MFKLEKLVRQNILQLKPYSSARDEFSGREGVFLDANENPFGDLNRYPDPQQKALKNKLSEIKSIPAEQIFIGNGSDEIIDLLFRVFCNPGKDKALTFSPTYGMYEVSAAINDIELIKVPLNVDFQISDESVDLFQNQPNLKLIFICSPNNPTGNSILNLEQILEKFEGVVVVDEAYIDFSENESYLTKLAQYPNLIVLQTLSKAWGLAAARVGAAYASADIIALLNKVKPPYNISQLNQQAALKALGNREVFEKQKTLILAQKEILKTQLLNLPAVLKIYPSDTNFLLVEVTNADKIYEDLVNKQVVTRNRSKEVANCLRITVGNPEENQQLLRAFQNSSI